MTDAERPSSYIPSDYPDDYHINQNALNESSFISPHHTYYDPDELDMAAGSGAFDTGGQPTIITENIGDSDEDPGSVQISEHSEDADTIVINAHPPVGYRSSFPPPPDEDQTSFHGILTEEDISDAEVPLTPPPISEQPSFNGMLSTEVPPEPPRSRPPSFYEVQDQGYENDAIQQLREQELSDRSEPQEEELTELYDDSPEVAEVNTDSRDSQYVNTAVLVAAAAPVESDSRPDHENTSTFVATVIVSNPHEEIHEQRNETAVAESDVRVVGYAGQSEPVTVTNNNAPKDVTWTQPSQGTSLPGYYAKHTDNIEMTEVSSQAQAQAPYHTQTNMNGQHAKAAFSGDEPKFWFKAKGPISMDTYFAFACLGFIFNVIFGIIALCCVRKGRKAKTEKEARKFGACAIVMAIFGLLVTVAIILAVGFTGDPPWTV